ncbi:MAG TPA: polyphenol oxidase family protein [Acidimicrobiales bacterium]|nr:polyphenol oxidase family protein [Acidimicrobiales bacterium]
MDTRGHVRLAEWTALSGSGVEAVVTTRYGGVSGGPYRSLNLSFHVGDDPAAVVENRRRAAAAAGGRLEDLVVATQVHGHTVAVAGKGDRGRAAEMDGTVGEADALVTAEPGLLLVVLVADCVPIVLFDPVARVLACVHAGWRGTCLKVVQAALDAMEGLGARRASTLAGIGPAIGGDAYEVGSDVAEAVRSSLGSTLLGTSRGELAGRAAPQLADVLRPTAAGRWTLDLQRANRHLLVEAGVDAGRVHTMPLATGGTGPFYSHRARHPCGRFGLLARMTP